jgi:transcriptional regulator with XRE-family HTH domain
MVSSVGAGDGWFNGRYGGRLLDWRNERAWCAYVGNLVIDLRHQVELTQIRLAAETGVSQSTVARIEAGEMAPMSDWLYKADKALNADGLLTGVVDFLDCNRGNPELPETDAVALEYSAVHCVPDLLQVPDYTRAMEWAGQPTPHVAAVETAVHLLGLRQVALFGFKSAPRKCFFLHESSVRRVVGGERVMRVQVRRLIDVAEEKSLRVLTAGASQQVGSLCSAALTQTDRGHRAFVVGPMNSVVMLTRAEQLAKARAYFAALDRAALPCALSCQYLIKHLATLRR